MEVLDSLVGAHTAAEFFNARSGDGLVIAMYELPVKLTKSSPGYDCLVVTDAVHGGVWVVACRACGRNGVGERAAILFFRPSSYEFGSRPPAATRIAGDPVTPCRACVVL